MHPLIYVAATVLAAVSLAAQNPVQGNGIPSAYVETTPGILGGQLKLGFGSPSTPNGFCTISLSGGFTPFLFPLPELGGPIAIDPFDPAYTVAFFGLDAQGDGSVTIPLSPSFRLPSDAPVYMNALTFESLTQWSVSKTVRIDWMVPDQWEPVAPLVGFRQLHCATPLGTGPRDNVTEVLVCGGATGSFITPNALATAELFSPLTRSVTPLPNMSQPRSMHRTVRLNDGRLLVTGGVTTGGGVLTSCEFFDPTTLTFSAAPPMSAARSGHGMTLLNDGRVLVTGGVSDWQNAATNFIAVLNSAQDTAEVFDPTTNSWSALPNMASKRLGHSHTLLGNGRVLVVSGINGGYAGAFGGGQLPLYTTSCEVFDPATDTFTLTDPLIHSVAPFGLTIANGRAFHGATLLPSGNVLVTGGLVATQPSLGTNDVTVVCGYCDTWDPALGTSGEWSEVAALPSPVGFHGCELHNGGALLSGGYSNLATLAPTNAVTFHDGTNVGPLAPMQEARAAHSFTRLSDGTLLVYGGGATWPATLNTGEVYAPN